MPIERSKEEIERREKTEELARLNRRITEAASKANKLEADAEELREKGAAVSIPYRRAIDEYEKLSKEKHALEKERKAMIKLGSPENDIKEIDGYISNKTKRMDEADVKIESAKEKEKEFDKKLKALRDEEKTIRKSLALLKSDAKYLEREIERLK